MANEASKVLSRVRGLLEGIGLDLGCGPFKVVDNATGVDEGGYEGIVQARVLSYLQGVPNMSQDFVFSSHYLEHEPEVNEVIANCERVLKPGGSFIAYLPDRRIYVNEQGNDANADHVNHWTPGEFVDLLLGLTDLKIRIVEPRNTTPPGHKFTGNGDTEDPRAADWEYGFLIVASK